LGTLTAGKSGKVYMIGLNRSFNLKWAPTQTVGYSNGIGTSNGDGSVNWNRIKNFEDTLLAAGSINAVGYTDAATNYPAFNYANTYNVAGYSSGWFLPSVAELKLLYCNVNIINDGISAAGGTALTVVSHYRILSSCQDKYNTFGAYFVTGKGGAGNDTKAQSNYYIYVVRALDD
ncbi:MAG: hypothetical protein II890_06305, partial [Spirochaetia bacterium]|nr:hypothetical protein [Spirochaetia bacterium]